MKSIVAGAGVKEKTSIKVCVEIISWLKEDFYHDGWDRLVFDQEIPRSSSIMDLLRQLAGKYPEFNRKAFADALRNFPDYCSVIFNGTFFSSLQDLDTRLEEGDNIKLTPGFYGG